MLNNVDPKFFSFVHILSGKSSLQERKEMAKFLLECFENCPFDQIETLHSSFKPTAFEPTRAQKPSWATTANSLFLGYGQSLQLWASIFATTKCKPHGNLQFKFFLLSILMLTCLASEARPDVSFRWSQQSLQPGSYFRLFGLF